MQVAEVDIAYFTVACPVCKQPLVVPGSGIGRTLWTHAELAEQEGTIVACDNAPAGSGVSFEMPTIVAWVADYTNIETEK